MCEIDLTREVDIDVLMEFVQIDRFGLGKVEGGTLSGIEEDAIDLRVPGGHVLDELWNTLGVSDVEWNSSGLFGAMLCNEGIEAILPPPNDYNLGAGRNELLCHSQANARGGTD